MNYIKYTEVKPFDIKWNRNCKSEMSDSQMAFLLGLIQKYKPRKIVEVGVSAGASTVDVIRCINELKLDCQMFSIDLSKKYYRDISKQCGYLISDIEADKRSFHTLITGEILPQRIDEIGKDIDFLILDSAHILPGEVLDFLVALPYLKEGAIVVMHDTILHYYGNMINSSFATNVLFHTVTADKFLNNSDKFPNIAAFRINEDTYKYILDVFCSLTLPWKYIPDKLQIAAYSKVYSEYYGEDALLLWNQALNEAKSAIKKDVHRISNFFNTFTKNKNKPILIYGAGNIGKSLCNILINMDIKVEGFIISDGQYAQQGYKDIPVYYYSEIPENFNNALVILSIQSQEIEKKLSESEYEALFLTHQIFEILEICGTHSI